MKDRNEKAINIYGIGITAVKFVLSHYKFLKIKSFIEGKRVKPKFMDLDIPVIDVKEAWNYLKKYYTVVACQERVYHEIKNVLESYGLKEFIDFEYHECFLKKVAIVYGNCHSGALKSYLRLSQEFSNDYGLYPVQQIQECWKWRKEHPCVDIHDRYKDALERCDLFIHQGVRKENYFGEEFASETLIKYLNSGCKKIVFPNLYRMPMFMFPQMISYTDNIRWEGNNWFFRDKYIDENYKDMTVHQLVQMIEDENLIPQGEIKSGLELFEYKVGQREQSWDIKILDFIRSSYGKCKLFYDPGHPTGQIMRQIAKQILLMMGYLKAVTELETNTTSELDVYEVPLYSSVEKALGLLGGDRVIRRYNGIKLRNVSMDFKEYVQQYLCWNHRISR